MSENIQVVVRCRTRNHQESVAKSPVVVELASDTFTATEPFVTVRNEGSSFLPTKMPLAAPLKVFKVDQVYGPGADQTLVFENVAAPLFNDFVAGLNVSLLAYGQTGSGKTHTMFGDLQGENAGIIPRLLSQLFAQTAEIDCCIKISCVELYKEELNDLINNDLELLPVKAKLRLVSEPSRDYGVASVQNLTELPIDSSDMGFRVLQKCLSKRRTSATKLNDRSSRLHTIFSIILYQKTNGDTENPFYRVLKMNLVDLAGSEDIHKSGAVNERAREAGSINQSLLTLGKVISSLSEGKEARHIPYRESKLTRLLQGLIGGKTKTALIATISPAKINIQETLSTLTYASKAKNIRNLPQSTQSSQTLLKKVLVKDLSAQIARLTRDLLASKDKDDGIKMSLQNYQAYGDSIRELESSVLEKTSEINRLSEKLKAKVEEAESLRERLEKAEKDSTILQLKYQNNSAQLLQISNNLSDLTRRYKEQNRKVLKLVESNVSEINGMIETTINGLTSGKDKTSRMISLASTELVCALEASRNSLRKKTEQLSTSIVEEAQREFSDIMKKSLDVSSQLEQIRNFDVSTEVKGLHENRTKLTQVLEEITCQESYQKILDVTTKELSEHKDSIERKIFSSFRETLKSLLAENETRNQKTIEAVVKSIAEDKHSRMRLFVETSSLTHKQLVDGISKKSHNLTKKVLGIEADIARGETSLKEAFGGQFQSMITNSLDEISQGTSAEMLTSTRAIGSTFSSISSKLLRMDDEALSKLRATDKGMSDFQAKIESLKSTTLEQLPVDKELRSRAPSTSPAAKRRKPMSPMKADNILYRSRIPQLGPAKQ